MFLRLCSRLESLQVTFFRTHTQIHTYIHHSGRSYEAQSVSQEKSKLMNWSCYFISLEIPTITVECVFPASKGRLGVVYVGVFSQLGFVGRRWKRPEKSVFPAASFLQFHQPSKASHGVLSWHKQTDGQSSRSALARIVCRRYAFERLKGFSLSFRFSDSPTHLPSYPTFCVVVVGLCPRVSDTFPSWEVSEAFDWKQGTKPAAAAKGLSGIVFQAEVTFQSGRK